MSILTPFFGSIFFLFATSSGVNGTSSALVDSDFVWGIDCDPTAMQVAMENIRALELEDRIALVLAHVGPPRNTSRKDEKLQKGKNMNNHSRGRRGRGGRPVPPSMTAATNSNATAHPDPNESSEGDDIFPLVDHCVDTVMTNPPFGTKPDRAGIDVQFLKLACRLATRAVYSFHKSSTRSYIVSMAKSLPNVENVTVIAEMKFDIPQMYKFHKKASVDVQVDLVRVQIKNEASLLISDHQTRNS